MSDWRGASAPRFCFGGWLATVGIGMLECRTCGRQVAELRKGRPDCKPCAAEKDRERRRKGKGRATAPVRQWGLGGPAHLQLPRPKSGDDYTVVGLFDLHGEWREPGLLDAALRLIRDLKPDAVVLGGDTTNFDVISRWQDKVLRRMTPLGIHKEIRREIEDSHEMRLRVRDAAGDAVLLEVEGNHCDRLRKYLSDDLEEGWETAKEWMRVDEVLDHYHNRAGVFIRPKFLVRHGSTTASYPAQKEFKAENCSGWTGHLHNAHVHYEKPYPVFGERFTHTVAPCMCRLDANYGHGNAGLMRWHQGLLVGTFSASDPHDHQTDIGLWNGKSLLIRGERY